MQIQGKQELEKLLCSLFDIHGFQRFCTHDEDTADLIPLLPLTAPLAHVMSTFVDLVERRGLSLETLLGRLRRDFHHRSGDVSRVARALGVQGDLGTLALRAPISAGKAGGHRGWLLPALLSVFAASAGYITAAGFAGAPVEEPSQTPPPAAAVEVPLAPADTPKTGAKAAEPAPEEPTKRSDKVAPPKPLVEKDAPKGEPERPDPPPSPRTTEIFPGCHLVSDLPRSVIEGLKGPFRDEAEIDRSQKSMQSAGARSPAYEVAFAYLEAQRTTLQVRTTKKHLDRARELSQGQESSRDLARCISEVEAILKSRGASI